MTLFKTLGAKAGFLDGSPLDLIFKRVALLEGWLSGSHITAKPS